MTPALKFCPRCTPYLVPLSHDGEVLTCPRCGVWEPAPPRTTDGAPLFNRAVPIPPRAEPE